MINKKFSAIWPNILKKKDPMKDHEKFRKLQISMINTFQKNLENKKYAKKEKN